MDTSIVSSSKNKKRRRQRVRVLNLKEGEPVVIEKNRRKKRKVQHFDSRAEFKLIHYLDPAVTDQLDKLRDDLQASIERTVRVQQAFVKQLTKHAVRSNRIKSVIKAIDIVPFHCDVQRKIIAEGVTYILNSAKREAKRLEEVAKAEELEQEKRELEDLYDPGF